MRAILRALILITLTASISTAQTQSPSIQPPAEPARADGIGVAPARFELPMLPGTEKTVVVNIIYNSVTGDAKPCRLVAYLGDWSVMKNGDVEYYKAGTRSDSASAWFIYSPGEVTALPGKVHPVRVTVSVPKDAAPGDHLAALFVESRPDNIKLDENRRQVVLRFRMAALFYIMVPDLTRRGSLEDLKAEAEQGQIVITPTIKNEGNSRIRPVQSVKVVDGKGAVVAELPEKEAMPVLAKSELARSLVIEADLPPGAYTVHYRVDFKDGGAVTEGQLPLVVK
jgi:hypothetical protein